MKHMAIGHVLDVLIISQSLCVSSYPARSGCTEKSIQTSHLSLIPYIFDELLNFIDVWLVPGIVILIPQHVNLTHLSKEPKQISSKKGSVDWTTHIIPYSYHDASSRIGRGSHERQA
jgi:hypothetical protein